MVDVAFIGLGNMGGAMAANLVAAGFAVTAYDPSEAALKAAVDNGCRPAATAVEAVQEAAFVVSMLPSGAIVEALYIDGIDGAPGLLDSIASTSLVIDCSTIAAASARRLIASAAERGIRAIDAPVSGGVAAAAAASLAFMCGGTVDDVAAAEPVLSAMGQKLYRAGDAGAGQVAKICNNMLLAIHMAGTAEALQLGINNGLDPAILSEIMLGSSGCNWSLEKYNPCPGVMDSVPASNDYRGGFTLALMLKDLGLALDAAGVSQSSVPLGSAAQGLYAQQGELSEQSLQRDFSSIMELYAAATNASDSG